MDKNVCILKTSDTFILLSARQLLKTNGISSFIPDEQFGSIYPLTLITPDDHGLFVSASQEREARELVEAFFSSKGNPRKFLTEETDSPPFQKCCPNCRSTDIVIESRMQEGVVFTITKLLGLEESGEYDVYFCRNCRYEWEVRDD